MIVIKCVAKPGISVHPSVGSPAGLYLRSYDPEYAGGRGHADWTANIHDALRFETPGEAWMLWRKQPFTRPWREDGRPNRPLTAFTIELIDEEDA